MATTTGTIDVSIAVKPWMKWLIERNRATLIVAAGLCHVVPTRYWIEADLL